MAEVLSRGDGENISVWEAVRQTGEARIISITNSQVSEPRRPSTWCPNRGKGQTRPRLLSPPPFLDS